MVEILDPGIAEGLAIEGTCRLCGLQMALGEIRRPGQIFDTPEAARQALQAWAMAEGDPDLASFCEGSLLTKRVWRQKFVDWNPMST